jgi:transcriptional regulator GlxA family with amidase domain
MSIASGIIHVAQTGILHKQRAAAPKYLLSALQSEYPETFWQQSSWARHERIWSSCSAISALDMIASWMREYFWDRSEAVECVLTAAGIGSLDEYNHCDY